MRKTLTILLVLFTSIMYLSAQGNIENTSAASERQMVSFTDDLGRVVDVPADISSVTPSGSMAQVILLTFDQSKISGLTTAMSDDERAYYPDLSEDIPVLGTFYGKKANLNKEALIVVNPDVVIDIGEIKGSVDEMISDLDVLQEQIGIPVVFIVLMSCRNRSEFRWCSLNHILRTVPTLTQDWANCLAMRREEMSWHRTPRKQLLLQLIQKKRSAKQ